MRGNGLENGIGRMEPRMRGKFGDEQRYQLAGVLMSGEGTVFIVTITVWEVKFEYASLVRLLKQSCELFIKPSPGK